MIRKKKILASSLLWRTEQAAVKPSWEPNSFGTGRRPNSLHRSLRSPLRSFVQEHVRSCKTGHQNSSYLQASSVSCIVRAALCWLWQKKKKRLHQDESFPHPTFMFTMPAPIEIAAKKKKKKGGCFLQNFSSHQNATKEKKKRKTTMLWTANSTWQCLTK